MYQGKWATVIPDKAAVINSLTRERRTYGELNDRSNRLAQLTFDRGLRRGDHIRIFAENHLACRPLQAPKSIDFTDQLPRLPAGKLYKRLLKDEYWGQDRLEDRAESLSAPNGAKEPSRTGRPRSNSRGV